jgi:hypothetical protein
VRRKSCKSPQNYPKAAGVRCAEFAAVSVSFGPPASLRGPNGGDARRQVTTNDPRQYFGRRVSRDGGEILAGRARLRRIVGPLAADAWGAGVDRLLTELVAIALPKRRECLQARLERA